jgi:hypothetical protein
MLLRMLVGLLLLLTVGCAPFSRVSGNATISELGVEVVLPDGWYRANRATDALLITRDGFPLQFILIERVAHDKELQYTKRKFSPGMPPHDVAELEADNLRSATGISNFELLDNRPVTIGGLQGFRLVFQWRTNDGLRVKRVHYGFMQDKWVYRIVYHAAARHYFDRDLPAFNALIESFKLAKT